MLNIKKTGEGGYLITQANRTEKLDRNNSYLIKKERSSIVKPHREIIVDIKGVKSINSRGYKIIQELLNMGHAQKCKIKFINAESSVSNKLSTQTGKISTLQEEFETANK